MWAPNFILLSLGCVEASEVAAREGVVGIDAQGVLEIFARFIEAAGLHADDSQAAEGFGVVGIQARGGLEFLVSFAGVAGAQVNGTQIKMRKVVGGRQTNGFEQMRHRFVHLSAAGQGATEALLEMGVGWIEFGAKTVKFETRSINLASVIHAERLVVFRSRGERLEIEFAHFVGGLQAPSGPARWIERVAGIVCAVVVRKTHRELRTFGHVDRRFVFVIALPLEIPIFDPDEPFFFTARERGEALHIACEIMGVGADADEVNVHRERVGKFADVIGHAGGNVEEE